MALKHAVPSLPTSTFSTDIVLKPVSCSGAIMGSYAGILEYFRGMEEEMHAPLASAPDCLAETHGRSQGARTKLSA